jgi:hypothetical protein
MIVGVLTTWHTKYASDRSTCIFFYLIEQQSKCLWHTVQVLYMCTLCDSTNINTIIEFVPNCLFWFVPSVPAYLREEEEHKSDPWCNPIERNHMGLHLENEVYCVWQVVKTPTIIFNNPVLSSISGISQNRYRLYGYPVLLRTNAWWSEQWN